MKKPNDIKRPNPKSTKIVPHLPEAIDGPNRLFRYRDGVVHKVILGDRRRIDPATGEWVTSRGAVYLKRVSHRPCYIRKQIKQFIKRRKNEQEDSLDYATILERISQPTS